MRSRLDYSPDGQITVNTGRYLACCSLKELAEYRDAATRLEHRAPRFCHWWRGSLQNELERRAGGWATEAEPIGLPARWQLADYAAGLAVVVFMQRILERETPTLSYVAFALAEMVVAHC